MSHQRPDVLAVEDLSPLLILLMINTAVHTSPKMYVTAIHVSLKICDAVNEPVPMYQRI